MNRIVVLSDPSKEFPDNKTNAFKSRLPREVQFEGDWEVGLTSISMPDRGLDLDTLFAKKSTNVVKVKYQLLDVPADSRTTRIEYVTRETLVKNESAIVDGVGLMTALFNEIDWNITNTLEGIPNGRVEDPRRPTFRWEGEVAVLERKDIGVLGSHGSQNVVEFGIDEGLAIRMGWLTQSSRGTYALGPNLRFSLYDKANKRSDKVPSTELPSGRLWVVNSGLMVLSFTLEWRFTNLRKAFQTAVTHALRTLLVYSDVVGSNVMGDAEHPLVREVHYQRRGGGDVYFEPIHIQWMPMRRRYLDVIEVSIAESDGRLAILGEGTRTIITFQFRRRPDAYV